ncbi:predicted protein [Verticillium alfalfae VaMs.102]|uniref:Predicted protein n=1 Tax=Verticillium alfalfae (strain VaMs.102 / ATCC MYA-4576 / FGSC 10136) TaxID=526221 RepID=C9S864_VERA1|nr:predicted protein [Verticillium alfalfae VaMs.102]EEY15314.1 predicted protein [Verticillium alfalfae VaMs.102]
MAYPFGGQRGPGGTRNNNNNMAGIGSSNLKRRMSQPNRLDNELLTTPSELSFNSATPSMAAGSDASSVRRRRARFTARPFKFRPPTIRFRSRRPSQNLNNSPYMSPGPYHSDDNHIESEPEFRWSSSNLSISTDATSIPSDDATTKSTPGRQLVRARSVPGRVTVGLRQRSQQNRQPGRVGLTLPDGRGRTYHISVAPGPLQDSPTPVRAKIEAPPVQAPVTQVPVPQAKGKGKGKGGRNKRKGGGAQARQVEALKESAKTSQDTPSSIVSNEEASAARSRSTSRHKGEEILLKQVEELKDEVKSLQDGQSSTARDLENALDKISVISAEKKDVERRLAEASVPSSVVRGFEHQYQMVDDAQSSLTTHSKHSRSASKGLQEVQGLQQDKADLQAKVSELEKDLTLYKDFKVCLEAKCDELQDEIKQQEERFKTDSEKFRSDVEDVEDLRKTQDAAHIARIVSLELSKESLQAKAQALEAEIARKDFEYGEFTTERDQLSKDKDAWVEEKKDLESRVEVLESEKSKLEEQTKALEETIKGLETERDSIQAHVVELENTNGELQSKVGGLEDDKSTIVSKSEKLKTKVDRLKGENGNLRTQVSSLLKDQDDHTSQVLTLSAERDGLKEENITLKAMSEAGSVLGSVVGSRVGRWVASDMGSQAPSEGGSVASKATSKAPSEVGSTVSKASKASSAVSKKSSNAGTKAPSQPDEKTSEVSATPASGDSCTPDIIEVTESEAGEPAAEPEAAVEEAPSAETTADPEQAALLATLQTQKTELETRNATLQEEASKVETLTTERDDLALRLATAEQDAAQVPALREENGGLATQLAETNAALESAMAAHAAANGEVDGLKAEVASLRSRLSSPSRRSGSTRTSRKDGDKAKQLVVVRDPNDRGQIQVIRRCDLRLHSRSASLSEGSGAD